MPETAMTMIFCYDIQNLKVRRHIAAVLEKEAVRVQQSVFEARMVKSAANLLFDCLVECLDDGDLLRMYVLEKTSLEACRTHGGAPIAENGNFWIL